MSLLSRTDVTAVKFYQNWILAGIGSYLEVFDRDSFRLIEKISVLEGQKIYGIVPSLCASKLLIFGGKQFSVLSRDNNEDSEKSLGILYSLQKSVVCNDWIHSGTWLSDHKVGFLTAHNVVQIWNIDILSLEKQHVSPDNSILYSALLLPLKDSLLMFSGTVFSDVIIHWCGDNQPLHCLRGHKGVIFSITCNLNKGLIVTTSDDRSVRIWMIYNVIDLNYNTKNYWQNAKIQCKWELYGHTARVMRSCITNNYIISVGEDSGICFWNYQGKLLKKILAHQNACIWSLDADDDHLLTGGGDCGVILHPLTLLTNYSINEVLEIDANISREIDFTSRGNIVIANENNELIYYDLNSKRQEVHKLDHKSNYKFLCVSSCKQIIAIADMSGQLDIFIESCKGDPVIRNIINTKLHIDKIFSMQWAGNRHLIICSERGLITVIGSKKDSTETFAQYFLPHCKERWLTSSALSSDQKVMAVSDRCGHIHVYFHGNQNPVKTFDKVHGRYGATTLTIRNNELITTGRDGTIKYFSISNCNPEEIKLMSCRNLEFQWVEKFLDKNEYYICGFQERVFVVYDIENNVKIFDVNCGGGHRSWDAIRYFEKIGNNYEECIKLIYCKNSNIQVHTFQLSRIMSKNIVHGTHSKEINCLKTYTCDNDRQTTFYISGGEDTTLRISRSNLKSPFRDEIIFKQLSSIRSLKTYELGQHEILLISAGGRAQICAKKIKFNSGNIYSEQVIDYLIKGSDKERKGSRNWKNCSIDFDPETRVMDLEIVKSNNYIYTIFVACSDGILRVFNLINDMNVQFKPVQEVRYHKTCILKTHVFQFIGKDILVTCTTRGEVAFWIVKICGEEILDSEPVFSIQTNKSGINSIDVKTLDNTRFIIATGGDDNAIIVNLIGAENNNLETMKVINSWASDKYHCSQITGLKLIDNLMVTTGIDQRVTLFKLLITNTIICNYVSQIFSDISDIHGIDVLSVSEDSIDVCVFGKGVEVLRISRKLKT